jgi:hypothetical protein
MDENFIKMLDIIKSIITYILPIITAFLGMKIQSSIDNKKDNKNYVRKRKEEEIEELKNYFKYFIRYFKRIIAQQKGYDFVIVNEMTHDEFLKLTSDKRYDDFDSEFMMLIQKLYFKTRDFVKLQGYIFELTQIWIQNLPINNLDEYKSACFIVINDCNEHQREIIDLIKIKQDELLLIK